MATGIIVLVIVIVILVAAGIAATLVHRRRALRQRFGPEYDQLANQVGEREAQAQLTERERRVAQLDIHPLSPERRAGYAREWTLLQERFIDNPPQALEAAATLVSAVAADRGYPADDEDRLLADLSVHHADRVDGYRKARRISNRAGRTGTEELRQALLGYRALFRDLLGPEPTAEQAAGDTDAAASGESQPAAEIARNSRARGDATDAPAAAGDGTGDTTTAAGDETGSASTIDGGDPLVDSGRDDDAAVHAARKE